MLNIKRFRESVQWSQSKLAQESGVSFPTIQKIEAGKANPTLEILEKLLRVMGLELKFQPAEFNLEAAIKLGVPLSGDVTLSESIIPSSRLLKEQTRYWMQLFVHQMFNEREELAVTSLLMALKDHYPSFYQREIKCTVFDDKIQEHRNSGKCIKLRRIALNKLSQYL